MSSRKPSVPPGPARDEAIRLASRGDEGAAILQALVESAPDLVIYVDKAGRIRFINRLAAGFQREVVIGSDWLAFVPTDHRDRVHELLQRTLASGEITGAELLGRGARHELSWYWTRIAPVRQGGQIVGAVLVARDITEKKRTEVQLMVSDRMASLGVLAAGVAHEINNPLASVIANLDLSLRDSAALGEYVRLPAEFLEQLRDARDGAERVRQIVRDLGLFSPMDDDELRLIQVEKVMDSTLRLVRNEIRHRARLVKNYQPAPAVRANEARLGQVFLNLLMNAVHAIGQRTSQHHEIVVGIRADESSGVVASVADTGAGIPADVAARLFTPFFTTKAPGEGTGLGLCICQRIVASFSGQIRFETRVGLGTRFDVFLPAAQQPAKSTHGDALGHAGYTSSQRGGGR